MLKALQAEGHAQQVREAARTRRPDEPENRRIPGESDRPLDPADAPGNPALAWLPPWPFPTPPALEPGGPAPDGPALCVQPFEPEARGKPPAPRSLWAEIGQKSASASLLAGTALSSVGRRGA
jgi:hypothetical protein